MMDASTICNELGIKSISFLIDRKFVLTNLDTDQEVMCGTILGFAMTGSIIIFTNLPRFNEISGTFNDSRFCLYYQGQTKQPKKGYKMTFFEH